MDCVKSLPPLPPGATPHVAALGGRLLELVRRSLAEQDWQGLRASHHRLLSLVPPEGATITELAAVLHMTKQAAGQFVGRLEASGYLRVDADAADRRRRVVRRTAVGDATVAAVDAHLATLEQEWAEVVGADRYRTFVEVLTELTGR